MQRVRLDHEHRLVLRTWRGSVDAAQVAQSIREVTLAARPDIVYRDVNHFNGSIASITAADMKDLREEIARLRVDERLRRSHLALVAEVPHDEPLLKLWVHLRDYEAAGIAARTMTSLEAAAEWLEIDPDWLRETIAEMEKPDRL